jgi:phage terminase large subunit GpA-like protein
MLTGGVDVQETTLYWTIRAWGSHLTSQNIAHGQAVGFPDIERIMNLPYYKENGEQCMVSLCLIDSGYDADSTYEFCATNSDWSLPVKGASNPMMSNFKLSKINSVKANVFGMNLVLVDGGKYKDTIASRMRKQNGRGSWMVYNGCDGEYANQVTAEHKINKRMANGSVRQVWTLKHSHGDNHYLDCEVYAFAAADIMGVRTLHLQEESERARERIQQRPTAKEEYNPEEQWIQTNEGWI